MKKRNTIPAIFFCLLVLQAQTQTLYVDIVKGSRHGTGTITDPLAGLEQAIALASSRSWNPLPSAIIS